MTNEKPKGILARMVFFRRKKEEPSPKPQKSFQQIVHDKVLTAEGWRRRTAKAKVKKK